MAARVHRQSWKSSAATELAGPVVLPHSRCAALPSRTVGSTRTQQRDVGAADCRSVRCLRPSCVGTGFAGAGRHEREQAPTASSGTAACPGVAALVLNAWSAEVVLPARIDFWTAGYIQRCDARDETAGCSPNQQRGAMAGWLLLLLRSSRGGKTGGSRSFAAASANLSDASFPGATRRLETSDPASARWARQSMRGSVGPSNRHPLGAALRSCAQRPACPPSRNTHGRLPSRHSPRGTP